MLSEKEKAVLIQKIEENTGLIFRTEAEIGNLCFLGNDKDLRTEFKLYFSEEDFRFYLNSFQNQEIDLPKDASEFWLRIEGQGNRRNLKK